MQANTVHIHIRRPTLDCQSLTFTLHNQSFSLRQRPVHRARITQIYIQQHHIPTIVWPGKLNHRTLIK